MPSYKPLINEYRGGLFDLVHMGYVCVVDKDSNVLWSVGDPDEMAFYRSVSKPIQALPVIARGLDKKYGLTDEETVIFSGSHQGDSFHVAALESIHKKSGLTEDMLCMNPVLPQVPHPMDLAPRKFYHNCSGKHTGALLLQRELGGALLDYWKADSPAQQEIRRTVALLSEFPADKVRLGLDGCGVPVFAVGMRNMAIAFKNLTCPERIPDAALSEAVQAYIPRLHRYPHMIRGNNMLCTLMNTDPDIVAKGGANGTYGFALKSKHIGVSIKMVDNAQGMWALIIAEILRRLGHTNQQTFDMLENQCPATIMNDNGDAAGIRTIAF